MNANAPNYIAPEPTAEQIALDEDFGHLTVMSIRLGQVVEHAIAVARVCSSPRVHDVMQAIILNIDTTIHDSDLDAILKEADEAGHLIQAYRENP